MLLKNQLIATASPVAYLFNLLDNEEKSTFIFDREKPIKDFSTSALRRAGRR